MDDYIFLYVSYFIDIKTAQESNSLETSSLHDIYNNPIKNKKAREFFADININLSLNPVITSYL